MSILTIPGGATGTAKHKGEEVMKHRHIYITVFIFLGFGAAFIMFRSTVPSNDRVNSTGVINQQESLSSKEKEALHPFANIEKRIAAREQAVISSWDEWLDATTEDILGTLVEWGDCKTPEEVEAQRKETRAALERSIAEYRKTHPPPKEPNAVLPTFAAGKGLDQYRRPQTSEALISEFDAKYLERRPESTEWDQHFPKEVFLQKFLDKGVRFNEYVDYADILNLRGQLMKFKDAPAAWRSGDLNIPITTNFEEYVDGFIDRKIWELDTIKKVSNENPDASVVSVFFPPSHPDKFLPVVGKMTYVRQKPSGAMMTWGAMLTNEQRSNLLHKGIQPEGIEIVFIDEEYNILSEKPKPFDRDKWREENSYDIVPEGLRAPDGKIVTPERYEEIKGEPMSADIRQRYDESVGTESPVDPNAARREAAREAAARQVAKVEFERFRDSMRQRKEFETMADKDVSRELARQFSQQFLSKYSLKQGTSKRLENALETMFQHGFEEGFRRVRRDSPSIADELERYLGETQRPPERQGPPQRPTPPKPSEAAPPQPEAP